MIKYKDNCLNNKRINDLKRISKMADYSKHLKIKDNLRWKLQRKVVHVINKDTVVSRSIL